MWPVYTNASMYETANMVPIPLISNPGLKSGPGNSAPFYNLAREAEACIATNATYCNKAKASKILDKYVDAQSFINGLVGLALSGNWDSIMWVNHNYFMYVNTDNKLVYVAWDLDNTATGTMSAFHPVPTAQGPFPWYHWNFTTNDYATLCPSYFSWQGYTTVGQFGCNAANNLMGRAWRERFFETFNSVYESTYALARLRNKRWQQQRLPSLKCSEVNAWYPSVIQQEESLYGTGPSVVPGWNIQIPKFSPLTTNNLGTSIEAWFDYFGTQWTELGQGNTSAWPQPIWGYGIQNIMLQVTNATDYAYCYSNIPPGGTPNSGYSTETPFLGFLSDDCYPSPSSTCKARCYKFFASCKQLGGHSSCPFDDYLTKLKAA